MADKPTERIAVKVTAQMLAAIEAMTTARNDSLSATVRALIEAGLRAYGRSKMNL